MSAKPYTIKQLAKLSGVTVRTLRFYDEIGLLKPATVGENGYRYYGREELLRLQQILFYRELGFELAAIRKVMEEPDFDKTAALRSHKEKLEADAERTSQLIATIDKTLALLEKEAPMKDDELYRGFDPVKQAEYEAYLVERYGDAAKDGISESKRRTKDWKKDDFEQTKKDYDEIHRALTEAIEKGLAPSDAKVQKLIAQHYAIVDRFWTPDRERYIALGRSYGEHPDFVKLYAGYHPRLQEFLAEAMGIWADHELE